MRGERQLLRLGEYLVGRASRQLPRKVREERNREWAAELPVILHDPQLRFAPRRAIRMLAYAADTFRGTALTHVSSRRRRRQLAAIAAGSFVLVVALAGATWSVWSIARAPGQPLNYLQLSWSLLLGALIISMLRHSGANVNRLIVISLNLMGVAVNLWAAAQSPGDWVNYIVAASLVLVLLAWWPADRWVRTRRSRAARKQV